MRPPRKHPSRLVLVGGFRYLRQLLHQGAKTRDGLGLYHFWTTLTFTFTLTFTLTVDRHRRRGGGLEGVLRELRSGVRGIGAAECPADVESTWPSLRRRLSLWRAALERRWIPYTYETSSGREN